MTKKIELQMLLREIISKYIINYLDANYSYSDNTDNNYYFDKDENLSVVTTIDEFVKEVFRKPSFPI
ncbi:MAG: nuclease, partial [Saccharolobus sp.]